MAHRLRRRSGTHRARDHRHGRSRMINSIIVTESGLVFGAGRDNQIRAWDSETASQLWSSRFGGNFLGSPAMYEMDGPRRSDVGHRRQAPHRPAAASFLCRCRLAHQWAGSRIPCRRNSAE